MLKGIVVQQLIEMVEKFAIQTTLRITETEITKLKRYIETVFADYNDINEDTRMQLELINQSFAELQVKHKELNKPRTPIGFKQNNKIN
jgi:hypothetical protein